LALKKDVLAAFLPSRTSLRTQAGFGYLSIEPAIDV